jgi:uncharacterized protein (UPF0332 family)
MGKKELAEAEILVAREKLLSFKDDYKGERWGNATINLFFSFEHLVKALLASVGMEARSHEGVKILFSMHFIKPGSIHPKVGRYFGNLYDRRVTAEYSPLSRSEFTKEEVDTYLEWIKESFNGIFPLLKENGVDIEELSSLLA